jgi:NAD(P)-dependent dehydrogenase (short-subunit alcohol dehydrogenase family)
MKRVCLLTGSGGKLGQSFCRQYAGRYSIAAVYRRRAPVEHADVLAIQADLIERESIPRVVKAALDRFGRIDAVVNNAVTYVLKPALDEETLASLHEQFELNVFAPLRLAAEVARAFWRDRADENRKQHRGVVNVSSLSGRNIYAGGQAAYSAAKAALEMLTRHLGAELASIGVRCNAVAPNAFPRIVAYDAVAASIARLDQGVETGRVLILDRDGEKWA